jgi:hypothetical protein
MSTVALENKIIKADTAASAQRIVWTLTPHPNKPNGQFYRFIPVARDNPWLYDEINGEKVVLIVGLEPEGDRLRPSQKVVVQCKDKENRDYKITIFPPGKLVRGEYLLLSEVESILDL